jgi:hypothetical protein
LNYRKESNLKSNLDIVLAPEEIRDPLDRRAPECYAAFLAQMKKDGELSKFPLVVFSTSNYSMDKTYCDSYGVELITKPSNMRNMQQEIRRILQHCAEGWRILNINQHTPVQILNPVTECQHRGGNES